MEDFKPLENTKESNCFKKPYKFLIIERRNIT